MFQFKAKASSEEVNPTNVNPNTALPNSYGKIRTLKEDYENFKAGNLKKAGEAASLAVKAPATPPPSDPQPELQVAIPQPEPKIELHNISDKTQAKPVSTFQETKKEFGGEHLNPLGSQTFFQDKSPFGETLKEIPVEKIAAKAKLKSGSNKTLTVVFSSLLLLAIIGGGFYYYWFFVKTSPAQQEAVQAPVEKETPATATKPESNNLRQLNIDIAGTKEENQKIIQTLAGSFLSGAMENDVFEIKVLDKNNGLVKPKDLETSLGITLPAGLAEKISDDYSLFMKKENSEIRAGAAFKLSATEGLAENLRQQEKTLPSNLAAFYLGKPLAKDVISFSSSRYKNADIRYFNFTSPPNTSFDYSIITDKQNSYFIFATSKYSIRSILDYMSTK
jgi:hypothetical protein